MEPRSQSEAPKLAGDALFKDWRTDLSSGLVVFLVALPLCLGIALASGAPLFAGIVAGILGGIVVGAISGSHISVSGPAAGLAVIVAGAISSLGSFPKFQAALVIAGVLQVVLSRLRFGVLANFVPHAVIKGMLAGIGLVILLKQIPHAVGWDKDFEGDFAFLQNQSSNTFLDLVRAVLSASPGAVCISVLALGILIFWETKPVKKQAWSKMVPGALVAVAAGTGLNEIFRAVAPGLAMTSAEHLVTLPKEAGPVAFLRSLSFPDFSAIFSQQTWVVAATIAVVASLESLLSLDAADRLDSQRRISSPDRELVAQGAGNLLCGLVGGIPVTSVVVRSSANAYSGAKTKLSTILHGGMLAIAAIAFPFLLNRIPLACLASVLLLVGYKLASPALFKRVYREGITQFLPFILAVLGVVFVDLLKGVVVGLLVGLFFVLRSNQHRAVTVAQDGNYFLIRFNKDLSFINKTELKQVLMDLPDGAQVLINGSRAMFIDHDTYEIIEDFIEAGSYRGISVELNDVSVSTVPEMRKRQRLLAETQTLVH